VVCEWFGLKTTRTVSSSLVSKPAATVFTGLASKPVVMVSPGLTSKPAIGFLVWPQNQAGFGLLVAPQNRRREIGVGHTSRSSSLLGVEASLARVFQFDLKSSGGAMTGGARGTIAEVASKAN
jgi:hypothetical protein